MHRERDETSWNLFQFLVHLGHFAKKSPIPQPMFEGEIYLSLEEKLQFHFIQSFCMNK